MAWSQINRAGPDHLTKPPNLQPPSLLCATDVAVPSEHTVLGRSWSNQPISASHQLYGNLNFSIMVQAHLWPSAHKSSNACIMRLLLLRHLYPPQVKGEQKFPYIFMIIFFELILIFSVRCYVSYPCQCGYLRPLTELKDIIFTPFCQQQQQSVTMRTGWEKMPFHFFNQ
jgi:hypothetical protein